VEIKRHRKEERKRKKERKKGKGMIVKANFSGSHFTR
jgi:hypothetical protein